MLEISGLGGSYEVESLTFYRMVSGMSRPKTTRWEYPFVDRSWDREIAEFVTAIRGGQRQIGDAAEAAGSVSVIERIYQGACG